MWQRSAPQPGRPCVSPAQRSYWTPGILGNKMNPLMKLLFKLPLSERNDWWSIIWPDVCFISSSIISSALQTLRARTETQDVTSANRKWHHRRQGRKVTWWWWWWPVFFLFSTSNVLSLTLSLICRNGSSVAMAVDRQLPWLPETQPLILILIMTGTHTSKCDFSYMLSIYCYVFSMISCSLAFLFVHPEDADIGPSPWW